MLRRVTGLTAGVSSGVRALVRAPTQTVERVVLAAHYAAGTAYVLATLVSVSRRLREGDAAAA
jgi:hypothetical protein